jgi:hypothetical protein
MIFNTNNASTAIMRTSEVEATLALLNIEYLISCGNSFLRNTKSHP